MPISRTSPCACSTDSDRKRVTSLFLIARLMRCGRTYFAYKLILLRSLRAVAGMSFECVFCLFENERYEAQSSNRIGPPDMCDRVQEQSSQRNLRKVSANRALRCVGSQCGAPCGCCQSSLFPA